MNVLGIVEHPNLVKLIGYCAEDDERGVQRLLVYEYMPNGSVDDHLSSRSSSTLSWPMRLKVALDSARGLKYLHEEMDFQVIHLLADIDTRPHLLSKNMSVVSNSPHLHPAEGTDEISKTAICFRCFGKLHLSFKIHMQVIFRDLKTSNILLDENWNAKLSDFGLARHGPSEGLTHVSTAVCISIYKTTNFTLSVHVRT